MGLVGIFATAGNGALVAEADPFGGWLSFGVAAGGGTLLLQTGGDGTTPNLWGLLTSERVGVGIPFSIGRVGIAVGLTQEFLLGRSPTLASAPEVSHLAFAGPWYDLQLLGPLFMRFELGIQALINRDYGPIDYIPFIDFGFIWRFPRARD